MSGFGDSDRLNQRKKDFKKGMDSEEARRKREQAAVQLRKQAREETLEKKRMVGDGVANTLTLSVPDQADGKYSHIKVVASQVCSQSFDERFRATQQLRKYLSVPKNPPIQEVIDTGIVPRVVELLKDVTHPELQFEAEWVLINIAAGTFKQTRTVVEAGALPLFIQLLQSPNSDVKEQAIWALGNIAGDSANLRDLVLHAGGLFTMVQILQQATEQSMLRNATWALCNLCRGKPAPPFEAVQPALSTLVQLIHGSDVEVLADACWALAYVSDGEDKRVDGVIEAGAVPRLVQLLAHASSLVQTPALRAVNNIVAGTEAQTQVVLQNGALPFILRLLDHPFKKSIRKEACWAISNIVAGSPDQIQKVFNNNIIPPVLAQLTKGDFDVKKEALWVVRNVTSAGNPSQIGYLVQQGCINALIELVEKADVKTISLALETLENILNCGKDHQIELGLAENPIVKLIEEADGLRRLESLQEASSEEVYNKVVRMLETHFHLDEDDCNFGVEAEGFGFGATSMMPESGFKFDFAGHNMPVFG
jgi:HEAT repeat protein